MSEEVLYAVADHVATLTLNRPERMNTISGPMLDTLARLLLQPHRDPYVLCVMLTATIGPFRSHPAPLPLPSDKGNRKHAAATLTILAPPSNPTPRLHPHAP